MFKALSKSSPTSTRTNRLLRFYASFNHKSGSVKSAVEGKTILYKQKSPHGSKVDNAVLQPARKKYRTGGGWVVNDTTIIRSFYHPEYRPFLYEFNSLIPGQEMLNYDSIRRRCQTRPREGLWWSISNTLPTTIQASRRSWVRRRCMQAFRDVLKLHGFDGRGTRLSQSQETKHSSGLDLVQEWKAKQQLKKTGPNLGLGGTLTIQPQKNAATASYENLKNQFRLVLHHALTAKS